MDKELFIPNTELKIFADKGEFSFGVDSILLINFAKIKRKSTVLDIGAGTGILSLGIFEKFSPKLIYAVEIQEKMAKLMEKSINANGIKDIKVVNKDLNDCFDDFESGFFDYIITNPPYIKRGGGIVNEKEGFSVSRHEIKLTLDDIMKFSSQKLKSGGEIFMINRPQRLADIIELGRKYKIEPKRLRTVHSFPNEKPKMIMISLRKDAKNEFKIMEPLYIYEKTGVYSKEIEEIYGKK